VTQICSIWPLICIIRALKERMDREFFATRLENVEHHKKLKQHLESLEAVLRTVAPKPRIAQQMLSAFQRIADRRQGWSPADDNVMTTGTIMTGVEDTPLAVFQFEFLSGASPDALQRATKVLHEALQRVTGKGDALSVGSDDVGDSVYFLMSSHRRLSGILVAGSGVGLLAALRKVLVAMRGEKQLTYRAVVGCGCHVGAVLGNHLDGTIGSMKFDLYGRAVAQHQALLDELQWGSLVMTSRLLRYHADVNGPMLPGSSGADGELLFRVGSVLFAGKYCSTYPEGMVEA
jgi:hypothetical protein